MEAVQGFFSAAQGENILVKKEGENNYGYET